jgi:hypothetical protein
MVLEYLSRPYPYSRSPFLVASGEKVAFEGRFFSIPAFAALLDLRLFTTSASHPVATTFKLYINKNSNATVTIEPSLSASGYERGTPHYANVITDIRSTLALAFAKHAADSDHSAQNFLVNHLQRQHIPYNLPASSRPDVIDGDYVHKSPVGVTPTGNELGAKYWQDIDLDEIQYQPFTRPTKLSTLLNIPVQPLFPAVIKNGSLPSTSTLDDTNFNLLGIGAIASGGMLVTGDVLVNGTTIKAMTGSGASFTTEGTLQQILTSLFPADGQLNRYYVTAQSGLITCSGRQSLYNPPTASSDQVCLVSVSEAGTSGYLVQHWPGNYYATSGIDRNGKAHSGLHFVDRLIYSLNEVSSNQFAAGRSPINGKKIFGHFGATDTSSLGRQVGGRLKYANNNAVYVYGGVTRPRVTNTTSNFEWATLDQKLSPASWAISSTTALGPSAGIFGASDSVTWDVADINAATSAGIITYKRYAQFGSMDRVVYPDADKAGDGALTSATITYETHIFREGTDGAGNFQWIELPPPQSPVFQTQTLNYYANTYECGNLLNNFYGRRPNFGFVNINGQLYIQWSDRISSVNVLPTCNKFSPVGSTTQVLSPPTNRSVVGVSAGGSHITLHVTTNNQIPVPGTIDLSPANVNTITFAAGIPMTSAAIDQFGPAVWDPNASVNYLYFRTLTGRFFFAKMNTSFVITQINEVDATDTILSGRSAVLSI